MTKFYNFQSKITKENPVQSEHFGRHFWLDDEQDLMSCPSNIDGTGDFDNPDYVSEWEDLEGLNLGKLLDLQKLLINHNNYIESLKS
tara:strand:- start:1387 stop:1647 length:261 start_codon:yes stop_codon:yes gene_type:complete